MSEEDPPPGTHGYTPCAHSGCPRLVPYDGTPEIKAESYCPEHRILFELDSIDGSTEDILEDD